jgi:hypothetical protein
MSKYCCSECNYSSNRKDFVLKHINRKIKCIKGTNPIVIEIPVEIVCEFCKKEFSTVFSLERHSKNSCKEKNLHIEKLLNKNKELEQKLALAEKKLQTVVTNQTFNITNNNTIIVLNGYNDTDISRLKDKHFLKAINKMLLSVPTMIKDVHFNPDIPENQNIYISNMRNGFVMVYNAETKNWDARPKGEMIDKLINDREYDIQEWLGEGDKYPKAMQKFNEYLEKKEEDGAQKMIKDEIELLLYNNRNMIKNKNICI